ncbi:hypothetical protein [Flavivirga spongiicola]|uniref:Uncharacterized protein n=1 Tax=Flavivirga spongiicola TaxID=421621 RepID=A0ABU7XPF4_9FLAO|nr:hypothetical protein [Flavivirga sp. MEBiC05379]MDO5977426.1 hypothetical protein [Flavivirga sp. MEBiC05379]
MNLINYDMNFVFTQKGAYAAIRVDGDIIGASDRSISFPSNT